MNASFLIAEIARQPFVVVIAIASGLIAFTIHEFAHAGMATLLGDPTAREEHRLSLNPFAHLDIVGFLMLLASGFGWTKPVPYNPYALKTRFGGTLLIPFAGPAANVLLAIASALAIRVIGSASLDLPPYVMQFLTLFTILNLLLAGFNILPFPPLDGARALLSFIPDRYEEWKARYERVGPFLLILVIVGDAWSGLHLLSGVLQWINNFIAVFAS